MTLEIEIPLRLKREKMLEVIILKTKQNKRGAPGWFSQTYDFCTWVMSLSPTLDIAITSKKF